jgi:hypothetical protein
MSKQVTDYFKGIGQNLSDILSLEEASILFAGINVESTRLNKTLLENRQRIEEMQYAIADAIPGVQRLGGNISDVTRTMGDIAVASRRNVIANTESVEKLYAAGQLLGENVRDMVNDFADIGIRFDQISKNIEDSIFYVQSIGGNAKEVMDKVLDNMENLNKFNFANGVQGLTKMAAQASMLRFNMSQTFNLAEVALDPEKAVELSSAFQRLGVMSGTLSDPFQLMNQSINDPEGLQNSIVEISKQFTYFDEKTKSFKINPQGMLTLRELEKQTGLNASEMSKMGLAAAELDARLSQISPRITFANEEDKQYLANISTLDEKGEYIVKIKDEQGKEDFKNLRDVTQEEMEKLIEQQKLPQQTLEDIQRSQLTAAQKLSNDVEAIKNAILGGMVTSPTVVKAIETSTQIITSISGGLSETAGKAVPDIRDFGETFVSTITTLIKNVATGEKSMGEYIKEAISANETLFGKIGDKIGNSVEDIIGLTKESLIKKGIDVAPFESLISDVESFLKSNNIINNNNPRIGGNTGQTNNNVSLQSVSNNFDKLLGKSMKSSDDKINELNTSFKELIDKVRNNESRPEEIYEWISKNEDNIKNQGESYRKALEYYSNTIKSDIEKTSEQNDVKIENKGLIDGNELNKLLNIQNDKNNNINIENIFGDIETLQTSINEKKAVYKKEFESLLSEVLSKNKDVESISDYINNNKDELNNLGNDFSKNMQDYAKKVIDEIKNNDAKSAATKNINESASLVDAVKNLTPLFQNTTTPNSTFNTSTQNNQATNLNNTNVSIDNRSSFIDGKNRVAEPIQSAQMKGGQSLTQLIQHKVEFGKITVDVQLPNNFSQLSTEQQQIILDKVFNDNKFTSLFLKVGELSGGQLNQDTNLSKSYF